ncbi:MAG: hypothetical protein U5J62_06295 [Desulfurivibrio sp.]|nr:hypothetical protein [Desulfurivibrio sp.]
MLTVANRDLLFDIANAYVELGVSGKVVDIVGYGSEATRRAGKNIVESLAADLPRCQFERQFSGSTFV